MTAGLLPVSLGALLWLSSGLPVLLLPGRAPLAERLAALLAACGSLLGVTGALVALLGGGGDATWLPDGLERAVALDGLSALFLLPVFLVPGLAAVYGLGYAAALGGHGRFVRVFQGLLTAGMVILLVAQNGMLFLVGWEIMALSAFALIATEHHKVQTRRAAWVYLVTAHVCMLCLVAVMALLPAKDGSLDWDPAALAAMPPGRTIAVFALALCGFAVKAGLMPAHVWLPAAHGNAPSHVSAVLSGVLIKMGAYGFLRVCALLPPLPVACGVVVILLGACSALLGIAATFGQGDLKRLLAYSSIENIGIVFVGIGLAMLGRALGDERLVVLGAGGALFHVLNHGLFKPLLFLCAGSVIHAAGARELDLLGGLRRRLPRTSTAFLVGAAAISGLPMLNGFAGEFVLYLGLFAGATRPEPFVALLATAVLGALAMTGGLALATFVRSVATVFLGHARSQAAAAAHESPASMTVPLLVLAALCGLVGLVPWILVPLLDRAIAAAAGPRAPGLGELVPLGTLSAVATGCALALGAVTWLLRTARRHAQPDTAGVGTWDCGFVDATSPRLQYTGTSFAQFTARLLNWTVRASTQAPAPLELFPGPRAFVRRAVESLLHGLLWPAAHRLADRCSRLRILQRGNLQIYLLYVLVVLVLLLTWSALAPSLP